MIFNIQKCSIHDGAGIRTTVFFKGCPLRCKWCANPESQAYTAEVMELPRNCIGCGMCETSCAAGAVGRRETGFRIDRTKCVNCMNCAEVCCTGAKKQAGTELEADAIFKEIYKDRFFYLDSGGGVTFSGGEPLTHAKLLTAVAKKCKANGINTAIESCGVGNYEEFKEALDYIDSIFLDIKHIDSMKHKELTTLGNEGILSNIKKIAAHGIPITIRTPVVPGCNDSVENIEGIAAFIAGLTSVTGYELLFYHEFGKSKYTSLGRDYELDGIRTPEESYVRELVKRANAILIPAGKECFYTKDNTRYIVTDEVNETKEIKPTQKTLQSETGKAA